MKSWRIVDWLDDKEEEEEEKKGGATELQLRKRKICNSERIEHDCIIQYNGENLEKKRSTKRTSERRSFMINEEKRVLRFYSISTSLQPRLFLFFLF